MIGQAAALNVGTLWRSNSIFVAVTEAGSGEVWGYGSEFAALGTPPTLSNVKDVVSTYNAITVLKNDATIECWGDSHMGGGGPAYSLTDVKSIYSTNQAFGAIHGDGKVTVWGDGSFGGNEDAVSTLTKVVSLFSTSVAFAALTEDGEVSASWGDLQEPSSGITTPFGCTFFPSGGLVSVKTIFSTHMAFAALHENGDVTDWGCYITEDGQNSPLMPSGLTDVVTIYSSYRAFAAVKTDGSIVSWGYNYGHVPDTDKKATTMATSVSAFAVVTTSNTLYGFGEYQSGGTQPPSMSNVVGIACNLKACVAIGSGGSLSGWGTSSFGANAPSVSGVVAVYTTETSFLAVDSNTVIKAVWGAITSSPSTVDQDQLIAVFTSDTAFAVIKSDGTIVSWNSDGVITSPAIKPEVVYGNTYYRGLSDSPHGYILVNDRTTLAPSPVPTVLPTGMPSSQPSSQPSNRPSVRPSAQPSSGPSSAPSAQPSSTPSAQPSAQPTGNPSAQPSSAPTSSPSTQPSSTPSAVPSAQPSQQPTAAPSRFNNGPMGCLLGEHSSHVTEHTCTKCERGKYANRRGQDECDACPTDFTTIGLGSNNVTDCYRICDAGYYDNPAFPMHNCNICPLGRFNPVSGSHECQACAPGRYAQFGEIACTDCEPGKFAGLSGESECTLCSADFNTSSSASTACSACPRFTGTDGREGSANCTNQGLYGVCSAGSDSEKSGAVCVACPPGQFSPTNDSECRKCAAGSYSDVWGATACTGCLPGAFSSEEGGDSSDSCINCPKGRYNPFIGEPECKPCEPGSYCNVTNLIFPFECQPGYFSSVKGGTSCSRCPRGQYQSETGTAACDLCPAGMYNSEAGSKSRAACKACAAGKVSSVPGAPSCMPCAQGQYQPSANQTSCMECSQVGEDLISNADLTDCVTNGDLLSSNVIDTLFLDGVAVATTFLIASFFVLVGMAMEIRRERLDETARLSRLQTVLKSFLAGFSFGSDVVLILGLLNAAPPLAYALLSFRGLHLFGGIIISLIFFSKSGAVDCLLDDSFHLRKGIHAELYRENFTLVAVTIFTTLCDVTMMSFFPFHETAFYEESKGFPSMSIMKLCLGLKVLQSLGSASCQMTFLTAMNNESSGSLEQNSQAEALFYLSIFASAFIVVMAITTVCLQRSVLESHESGNRNSLSGGTLASLYPAKDDGEEEGVALPSPSSSWKSETAGNSRKDRESIRYSMNPMMQNLTKPPDDFSGRDDIGPRLSERSDAPPPDMPSWLSDRVEPEEALPVSIRASSSRVTSSRKSKNLLL